MNPVPFDAAFTTSDENNKTNWARFGLIWTDSEKKHLEFLYREGFSLRGICRTLQRPAAGVLAKLVQLKFIRNEGYGNYFREELPAPKVMVADLNAPKIDTALFTENYWQYSDTQRRSYVLDESTTFRASKSDLLLEYAKEKGLALHDITLNETKENDMIEKAACCETSSTNVPTFETKTFIKGRDAKFMTDREIFSEIIRIESELKDLDKIETRSQKLNALITKMKDDASNLAKYVDNRE